MRYGVLSGSCDTPWPSQPGCQRDNKWVGVANAADLGAIGHFSDLGRMVWLWMVSFKPDADIRDSVPRKYDKILPCRWQIIVIDAEPALSQRDNAVRGRTHKVLKLQSLVSIFYSPEPA